MIALVLQQQSGAVVTGILWLHDRDYIYFMVCIFHGHTYFMIFNLHYNYALCVSKILEFAKNFNSMHHFFHHNSVS